MKIYTKTGDKGTTKLVDGCTVNKDHPQVEAYGTVDELNSHIGLARSFCAKKSSDFALELNRKLEIIQNQLFSVGSLLATEDANVYSKLPQITDQHLAQLENWIDQAVSELPELKNFILPAGDECAGQLHICRTICRRSERRVARLLATDQKYSMLLIYLNRLSDLLFCWARYVNLKMNITETIWKKENV